MLDYTQFKWISYRIPIIVYSTEKELQDAQECQNASLSGNSYSVFDHIKSKIDNGMAPVLHPVIPES